MATCIDPCLTPRRPDPHFAAQQEMQEQIGRRKAAEAERKKSRRPAPRVPPGSRVGPNGVVVDTYGKAVAAPDGGPIYVPLGGSISTDGLIRDAKGLPVRSADLASEPLYNESASGTDEDHAAVGGPHGNRTAETAAISGGGSRWQLLSLSCVATRRPASATADPPAQGGGEAKAGAGSGGLQRIATKKKKLPPGISPNSPAARHLMYEDAPEPGMPAPISPANFLSQRFNDRPLGQVAYEHEGAAEPLYGPAAQHMASAHLQDGWSARNLDQFRRNELACQQLFGDSWDPRYGRSRVRSVETGELLCWGDGETYMSADVANDDAYADSAGLRADLGRGGQAIADGAQLREALREGSRNPRSMLPPKATEGRAHLKGHPMGDALHRKSSGYYRWLNEDVRGVDVGAQ